MRFTTSFALASGIVLAGTLAASAWPATTRANSNVRSGPSGASSVLGTLPAGAPVEVVSCRANWCQTQYGYVSSSLLTQVAGVGSYMAAPTYSSQPGVVPSVVPYVAPGVTPQPGITGDAAHPGDDATMSGTRTTVGTANVRNGPGTQYEIIKTLPDATSVEVKGCADSWCQTNEGYISLYVLSRGAVRQVLTPQAQPRLPGTQPQGMVTGYNPALVTGRGYAPGVVGAVAATTATTATVNVRSGPGVGYDVLGTLPAGSPVSVVGCSGAWCQTQYGYVSARYVGQGYQGAASGMLARQPISAAPAATYVPPSYRQPVTAVPVGVPAYSPQPGVVPSVAPYGAPGIAPQPGIAGDAAHPGDDATMSGTRTTVGTANVRNGPGTQYEIIKTLPDATSVEVKGCADSWCQTNEGYISLYVLSRGAVRQVLTPQAQPRLPGTQPQGMVTGYDPALVTGRGYAPGVVGAVAATTATTATVNVRSGPGVGYDVLGTLPAGSPVSVVGCSGAWCQTQYGYVSARYVGQGYQGAASGMLARQPISAAPAAAQVPNYGSVTAGRAYALPSSSFQASLPAQGPAGGRLTQMPAGYAAVTVSNVNVRTGPGTGYDVIGTLPSGSNVDVRSCSGSWCETVYGYVSAPHLSTNGGGATRVTVRPSRVSSGGYSNVASSVPVYADTADYGYAAQNYPLQNYPGQYYPGGTYPVYSGSPILAALAAPVVGVVAAVDTLASGFDGWSGGAPTYGYGYGFNYRWRASWGPGYWGPGLNGRNRPSSWGARPSYWGGRPTYWNMHPGYANNARFGDRKGNTYWSARGGGRLPQRPSYYSSLGPNWQGPFREGPGYRGRPVVWRSPSLSY
ncbi:SH3 domain-containing protein [Ancylobacter pratisalsi]|uniref:SH3 domain-containing protein n=1 Tax=Ancylobacter pratisalsi TaxID=1745854 RepID=A0A6P1YTW5_9HYPH|nr:SH3 domain-containing protein [Ancylobacter pratisalsi]QIB35513.1 SH3 domain-containing protein [Ancylobacter pratisalsi]